MFLSIVALVSSGFGLLLLVKFSKNASSLYVEAPVPSDTVFMSPTSAPPAESLYVYISGAVNHPGVFALPPSSRIVDALQLAGGLSTNARRSYVSSELNLAQKIKDELSIFIPCEEEVTLSAQVPVVQNSETQEISSTGALTNLNTADKKLLISLSGIGESYATKIIDSRPIGSYEELITRVKIPKSVVESLEGTTVL